MIINPEISICIPAYKQVAMVKRLLNSIICQTFKDYEIIITDDSPDESVKLLSEKYTSKCRLKYVKNDIPLGTPENWNKAIALAEGKWIKLMHQDDWFARKDALEIFHLYTKEHTGNTFFFSAFINIDIDNKTSVDVGCNFLQRLFLAVSPLHLFKKVYIGNPSCTLLRKDIGLTYDKRLKFVVDFEYYIRCVKSGFRWRYIPEYLINVGFHSEQVTQSTFLVPEVQIPENNLLIEIMGEKILNNYFVFDYYWRLYRNMNIRTVSQASVYDTKPMRQPLQELLRFQSRFPASFLKNGIFSKITMTCAYLMHRLRLF